MPIYKESYKKNGKLINRWYIRTYINGKQITRHNKKWIGKEGYYLAVEEEINLKKKLNNNVIVTQEPCFQDFINTYKDEIKKTTKESSYYSYFNVIKNQIMPHISARTKKNNLNINLFREWHLKLEEKGLSIEYMNKCHHVMKAILDIGVKYYGMETNYETIIGPFKQTLTDVIADEKKIRYITFEEFSKLILNIKDTMWKTFFIFLYYTGMRKGEIQALTWKDIDFKNNEIIVNKTLTTKTDEKYKITSTKNSLNRKVKMSTTLKKQLLDYKQHESRKPEYNENWFVFGENRFLPSITIDRKKHYFFELSNVKEITIHEFRHSHVSLLINEYIKTGQTDMAKFFLMMSNRMGHTIKVMQETYMHLFPTIQDEIVSILDNLI